MSKGGGGWEGETGIQDEQGWREIDNGNQEGKVMWIGKERGKDTRVTIGHRGQLNTHYHRTTYPSSTYDMTRLQQNRRTFTNYKKADWTQFTEDTESAFAQTTIPTNIHTANRIFTNIILMADKQNIPKGKMHSNCRLLPEDIVCKIT